MIEARKAIELVQSKLSDWIEGLIAMLPNVVLAALIVVVFSLAARLARQVAIRLLARFVPGGSLQRLIGTTVHLTIVLVGFFTALSVLHLDKAVTSLLAGAGILGLALGFAFQDIASNFIAGVLMAVQRPIRMGELVETGGHMGVVQRIDLRTTELRNMQGLQVILPNRDVFQNALVNYTRNGFRRVDLPVGISYAEDLEHVERVTIEAVKAVPDVLPDRGGTSSTKDSGTAPSSSRCVSGSPRWATGTSIPCAATPSWPSSRRTAVKGSPFPSPSARWTSASRAGVLWAPK